MLRRLGHLAKTYKAVTVAIALSFSFALMGVWVRMMGDSFDDFQQSYLRILLAGLIALVVFRRRRTKKLFVSVSRREWGVYAARALVGYLFGVAIFTVAIQNADLGVVSFISSIPTLGLLALIMFGEKLPLASIPFLVLTTVGVFFLTGADFSDFHLGLGEIASIVAALGFNIGFLMSRLHKPERNNYDNTTILLLIGWVPAFVISLVLHERLIPDHLSLVAIAGLILSALFNIVGLYATNYVFTNLKAYVAGNILLLEGVWAGALGFMLYAEPITAAFATGGLLIVVSAMAINKINNRNQEAQTAILEEPS